LVDLIEETDKTFSNTEVAGKEYKDRACCESGKTVPSGSCAAEDPSQTIPVRAIIGIVLSLILVFIFPGATLIILGKEEKKKQEAWKHQKQEASEHVPVPVAVPVQAGDSIHITARNEQYMESFGENVSMVQPPGASAPPAPVNPLFQSSARVYK
jgi:hypothetical protein